MKFITLFAALLVLTGCLSTGKVDKDTLKFSTWQVYQVDGKNVQSLGATIRFIDALQVNGFSGCNRFFGEGKVSEGTLQVSNIGMTRKLCRGEVAKLESQLIKQLESGVKLELDGEQLILVGNQRFTLVKK